jgi:hypothetical protein
MVKLFSLIHSALSTLIRRIYAVLQLSCAPEIFLPILVWIYLFSLAARGIGHFPPGLQEQGQYGTVADWEQLFMSRNKELEHEESSRDNS